MGVRQRPYCVWFGECTQASLPTVGGKNANLGEMINSDIRVPPGFAVTVEAYNEALTQSGVRGEVESILSELQPDNLRSIDSASQKIRHLIHSIAMPSDIAATIDEYYQALAQASNLAVVPVSVRSSATAEDLPGASFAGQQETYLWVIGEDEVKKRVIDCWSSLFTFRAVAYRIKKGFEHEKVSMSVGVQKMVKASCAGVVFTLNPVNGDLSKILLSGSWGLGEAVVSGTVTPDEWMVDKVTFEILRRRMGPKTIEHVVDPTTGEVVVNEVPSERQNVFCLSDDELIELARISKRIEEHYGVAQDIEWAIDRELPFPENVFILQTRAETAWSQREREAKVEKGTSPLAYILRVITTGEKL